MAKGQESAKIVQDFVKNVNDALERLQTMTPCIIPESDDDTKLLQTGLLVLEELGQAIHDCSGSLADLDEIIDVDKVVSDYPSIKNMFSRCTDVELTEAEEVLLEKYGGGDE